MSSMGMVGNFGSRIVFETSDRRILTFSGMTKKVLGKYAKHSVVGKKDRTEFTGPGNISITFKILLDVTLGVKPREVMDRIEEAVENGETEYLVIGGKPLSQNKFCILSASEAFDVVMSHGEIARATMTISMEEYL